MDLDKRARLVAKLGADPEPQLATIDEFFDGNDDEGSIGCNLWPKHPGVATFQTTLLGIASRPDVSRVVLQISELDPGQDAWPFSDVVFVAGAIAVTDLEQALSCLEPDEVVPIPAAEAPDELASVGSPIFRVWWD